MLHSAGDSAKEYDGVDEFEKKINDDFAALNRVFVGNGIEADLEWEAENVCDRHKADSRVAKGVLVRTRGLTPNGSRFLFFRRDNATMQNDLSVRPSVCRWVLRHENLESRFLTHAKRLRRISEVMIVLSRLCYLQQIKTATSYL